MTQIMPNSSFSSSRLFLGPPELPHYRLKLARQIKHQI